MFLVWESPRGRVARELSKSVLIVGRDAVSDLYIDDPSVSPRHALVQVDGGRVRVTDLRSSAGTRINGARLVPELPSTLEPGDFLLVGSVLLGLHRTPPPAQPPPAAPPRRAPRGRKPLGAVAVTLGLAGVVAAGALLAVLLPRDEPAAREGAAAPPPATVSAPAPPPLPPPEPPPPAEEPPPDEFPPASFADVERCPELLDVDGERYLPAAVQDWDGTRVEAVGADGRRYRVARGRVTKIEDRKDLARRAAQLRGRLAPEDADARLELARWCAKRFLGAEAKALAEEVLRARPGDAGARAVLEAVGTGG